MSFRIGREDLFMGIADLYAQRSTCLRAHVGAVAIRDGRVVAAGYNGAPAGLAHCIVMGCMIVGGHCVRAVHAEANLVAWAARVGTPLRHVEVYSTMQPCLNCSKLLVNSGVARVIFRNEYIGEAMELVEELGLKIERYEP